VMRAWIFDLGKTLMEIPDEYDEEYRLQQLLGFSDMDSVRSKIYSLCNRFSGQSVQEFLTRFDQLVNPAREEKLSLAILEVWQQSIEHATLEAGALELLDCLRAKGVRLALVSNTPPTSHEIIDRLHLRERFDEVVFSCDVGYLKPDPRIFQVALKRLATEPRETVIIGDKIRTDILGGAILGMKAILLERRLRTTIENGQHYVDAIISSLADVSRTKIWSELC